MAAPLWSSTHQPTRRPGRAPARERHAGLITTAEDLAAASIVDVMAAAVQIALGNAVEHLINHKTGQVNEVPVQPATRLKAQAMVMDRVMGKAEQTRTHEIGQNAAGVFRVLLGGAAAEHWHREALDAPSEPLLTSEVGDGHDPDE